jgi:hypothetical protein
MEYERCSSQQILQLDVEDGNAPIGDGVGLSEESKKTWAGIRPADLSSFHVSVMLCIVIISDVQGLTSGADEARRSTKTRAAETRGV